MSKQYDNTMEICLRERALKEAPSTPHEPVIEANVTKAELAVAKENWLRKREEAREEGVIFTRDEEREKMVDDMCYAAMKARQNYKALKEEYELEEHAKDLKPNVSFTTTPVEKRLSIRDMKRVMTLLVPGQEITWAIIMEQVVTRGIPGEEALALHGLIPQLTAHKEAKAKATSEVGDSSQSFSSDTLQGISSE